MSKNIKTIIYIWFNKKLPNNTIGNMKKSHSKPVLVTDILNNKVTRCSSIKEGASMLNTTSTRLRRCIKNKIALFDRYYITLCN